MRILPARSRVANATTVAGRAAVLLVAGRVLRAGIAIAGRVRRVAGLDAMIAAAAYVRRDRVPVAESRADSGGRADSVMIAAVVISAISVRRNRRRRVCLS
jgi:hypothetical protein